MNTSHTPYLGLDLVRVTEAAAIASAVMMGRNDKNGADGLAVTAMREALNSLDIQGTVIIGEGEKDEAPMLYIGEKVGSGSFVADIAVDPIDGTRLLSKGLPGSIAVIALAETGTMHPVTGLYHVTNLATGKEAASSIDITKSISWNIQAVAKAKNLAVENLTVAALDREYNEKIIDEIRATGARLKLFMDGTVAVAIMTALADTDVDLMVGGSGAPEAVITAAALKCLGGGLQCMPLCKTPADEERAKKAGVNFQHVFTRDELVSGSCIFVAITGITSGELVKGVRYEGHEAVTNSLVFRSESDTIRHLTTHHTISK